MLKIKYVFCFLFLGSCKSGVPQAIILVNGSPKAFFYCLYRADNPTSLDIDRIRPNTDEEIEKHFKNLAPVSIHDSLRIVESMKTNYLIRSNEQKEVMTSRAVSIFLNKERIPEIITHEYDGRVNISLILKEHIDSLSTEEIIKKGLYFKFSSISAEEIVSDTTYLKYTGR